MLFYQIKWQDVKLTNHTVGYTPLIPSRAYALYYIYITVPLHFKQKQLNQMTDFGFKCLSKNTFTVFSQS